MGLAGRLARRDGAGQDLDSRFDEQAETILHAPTPRQSAPDPSKLRVPKGKPLAIPVAEACCTPTSGGQSCC